MEFEKLKRLALARCAEDYSASMEDIVNHAKHLRQLLRPQKTWYGIVKYRKGPKHCYICGKSVLEDYSLYGNKPPAQYIDYFGNVRNLNASICREHWKMMVDYNHTNELIDDRNALRKGNAKHSPAHLEAYYISLYARMENIDIPCEDCIFNGILKCTSCKHYDRKIELDIKRLILERGK